MPQRRRTASWVGGPDHTTSMRAPRSARSASKTPYLLSNVYTTVDPTEHSWATAALTTCKACARHGLPHSHPTGRGSTTDQVATLRATHIDLLLARDDLTDQAKQNITHKNALTFLGRAATAQ
jgi:hypothetical protein